MAKHIWITRGRGTPTRRKTLYFCETNQEDGSYVQSSRTITMVKTHRDDVYQIVTSLGEEGYYYARFGTGRLYTTKEGIKREVFLPLSIPND